MKNPSRNLPKGELTEEAFKGYFSSLGYFVVRSVPFVYQGYDVTDIDLWLYMKSSSLSRERICVDIKRKKTPQAMERVFWTKGLGEVLGMDRVVIVTTDNRKETVDFGSSQGVTVFGGESVQGIVRRFDDLSERLSEEEFIERLKISCILDSSIVWPHYYKQAKALLLTELGFNGTNLFLERIHFLIEEYLASNKTSNASLRILFAVIGFFLLAVDYSSRQLSHIDPKSRRICLAQGLRYGDAGKQRTVEIIDTALNLLKETSRSDLFSYDQLQKEVDDQLSSYPAEMLAEFLTREEMLKQSFQMSKEFGKMAFMRHLPMPHEIKSELKGTIGLLCDFFGLDRRQVI